MQNTSGMTVRTLQTAFLLAAMAGLLPHALGQAGKRHEWDGANVDSNAFSRDGSSRLSADEKKQVAEWENWGQANNRQIIARSLAPVQTTATSSRLAPPQGVPLSGLRYFLAKPPRSPKGLEIVPLRAWRLGERLFSGR